MSLAWIWLVLITTLASCTSENRAAKPSVNGKYAFTATDTGSLWTKPDDPNCPPPLPPKKINLTVTIEENDDNSTATVTLENVGCAFQAKINGTTVYAEDAKCELSPPLTDYGVISRRMVNFSFDTDAGTWRRLVIDEIGSDGNLRKFCTVDDGRVLAASDIPYSGVYEWCGERPGGCVPNNVWDKVGGNLMIDVVTPGKELVVYEQGVGCAVHAKSADGIVYRADGQACELDPDRGLSQFGVTSRVFNSYELDTRAKTLNFEAIVVRRVGELNLPHTDHAKLVIEGDLP